MKHTGSPAASLLIWAGTGIYTVILALIYAELSTIITVSGGDYAYVFSILGKVPGFLVLWGHCFLSVPGTNAVVARTVGEYFLQVRQNSIYIMYSIQNRIYICRQDILYTTTVY